MTARVGVKYSTFPPALPQPRRARRRPADDVVTDDVSPRPPRAAGRKSSWRSPPRPDVMIAHPGLAIRAGPLPDAPEALLTAYRRLTDRLLEAGFSARTPCRARHGHAPRHAAVAELRTGDCL
ncbi:hypothetical protein HBB16_15110 [Pseudonocardia sp. MCCB 268]|nr:hypothetical protein [Pseudonocardia cytotoxica]